MQTVDLGEIFIGSLISEIGNMAGKRERKHWIWGNLSGEKSFPELPDKKGRRQWIFLRSFVLGEI